MVTFVVVFWCGYLVSPLLGGFCSLVAIVSSRKLWTSRVMLGFQFWVILGSDTN